MRTVTSEFDFPKLSESELEKVKSDIREKLKSDKKKELITIIIIIASFWGSFSPRVNEILPYIPVISDICELREGEFVNAKLLH